MCGIMGYKGNGDAVQIILDGLKKLEYRGYDSAGIAIVSDGRIYLDKKVGRLSQLEKTLNSYQIAHIGIGHTRWATHGAPSDENSHPHVDCNEKFAVVHNGIIENYAYLRQQLKHDGHIFRSETDTEVIVHLIESCYRGDLVKALQETVQYLEGSYALAVICEFEPEKIVAIRKDSPLIVGLGQNEYFLASDIPAILGRTDQVYIMEDDEIVILDSGGVTLCDLEGTPINKEIYVVPWAPVAAEMDGFPNYMIKEIHEQPCALFNTLQNWISGDLVDLTDTGIDTILQGVQKIFIVGCGTPYHSGITGKYVIEYLAGIPVEVDIASEFRYRKVIWPCNSVLIVISQSGETADTLAALREAKKNGIKVIAVTNVMGSSISREADAVLFTFAGPEIAVASTKAYITQLLAMYLIGLVLAEKRSNLDLIEIKRLVTNLKDLPRHVETILNNEKQIEMLAIRYKNENNSFFIGRGQDYAVVLEGALKLKEISYIHAEAYAAGELKHGPLALIVQGMPVIALITQDDLVDKMISNIKEVKARGGIVIGITKSKFEEIANEFDHVFYIPDVDPLFTPILSIVPLQLFAYYTAISRGCDVDKPRNLAKSVTVE